MGAIGELPQARQLRTGSSPRHDRRAPRTSPRNPRFRRTAVLLPAVIRNRAGDIACQVLNISASGALIRIPSGAEPANAFAFRIERHPDLYAEVVRNHGDQFGIAFIDRHGQVQAIIDRLLSDTASNRDLRRFPRRLVLLSGSFYLGDQLVPFSVHNLSAGGAFLAAPARLGRGHEIRLRVDRFGTMPAAVVWSSRAGMGASFWDEPTAVLDRIGHLLPPTPRDNL